MRVVIILKLFYSLLHVTLGIIFSLNFCDTRLTNKLNIPFVDKSEHRIFLIFVGNLLHNVIQQKSIRPIFRKFMRKITVQNIPNVNISTAKCLEIMFRLT